MKLQLAYDNELELTNLPTYRGRVSYINNNIFNNSDYIFNESENSSKRKMTFEEFYNIRSLHPRNEVEEKQIRSRWLGVKRVGSPHKDEHFKLTFDFIAGYLLYCKEYSARHNIHMYKLLKRKDGKEPILTEEKRELDRLEKNVISFRDGSDGGVVFYFNQPFENFLKRRLKEEENIEVANRISRIIQDCKKLRMQGRRIDKDIQSKEEDLIFIKSEIQSDYQELKKDRNNNSLFESITESIMKIRRIEQDIYYLEVELKNLVDDYLQLTELQINSQ